MDKLSEVIKLPLPPDNQATSEYLKLLVRTLRTLIELITKNTNTIQTSIDTGVLGMMNLVEDLTPQLGGDLDWNTKDMLIRSKLKFLPDNMGDNSGNIRLAPTTGNGAPNFGIYVYGTPTDAAAIKHIHLYIDNDGTTSYLTAYEQDLTISAPTKSIQITGDKIGVFGATPVVRQNHISDPAGGATVDSQSRTAINSILAALESYGLLKTS